MQGHISDQDWNLQGVGRPWCAALHGGVCSSSMACAVLHGVCSSSPWRRVHQLLVTPRKASLPLAVQHWPCQDAQQPRRGRALPCAPCSNGRAQARGLVYGSPRRGHRVPGTPSWPLEKVSSISTSESASLDDPSSISPS